MLSLLRLQNTKFLCLLILIFCQLGHREQIARSKDVGVDFLHVSAMAVQSRYVRQIQGSSQLTPFGWQKTKPLSNQLPHLNAPPLLFFPVQSM